MKGAETLGFNAYGLKTDINLIDTEKLPCIAHVVVSKSYQHFIVIYNIDKKKKIVTVMDPAKGRKRLSFAEFNLLSTGNFLFFYPTKKIPNMIHKKIISRLLVKIFKKQNLIMISIIIASIIYFIFDIITAFTFKYLLEACINQKSITNLYYILLLLLFSYILKEFIKLIQKIALLKSNCNLDYLLTIDLFKQIILFPYLFFKNRTTGEILARVKDLGVIKNYIAYIICILIPDLLALVIFIIFLFNVNKLLTIYIIIYIVLILIISFLFKNNYAKKLLLYIKNEERLNSYLIEIISANEVIKNLHLEDEIIEKITIKYQSFLNKFYQVAKISEYELFIKQNINNILMLVILGSGSYLVISNKMLLSDLIVFQTIILYIKTSFISVDKLIKQQKEYLISKDRIEDLYTLVKENFKLSNNFNNYNLRGIIVIKNLSFSYNNKLLLDNINLKINYKTKLLLYGESGCGKSTLMKILMRYIDIPFNKISIKNIDINHYHLATIRSKITYVSQKEYLFTDTLYNNIVMNRNINADYLEEILEKTKVKDIIDKNILGLNTIIEEDGYNLSGGQKQRIVLARSILKDSDIYIFDEAFSQLDSKNEKEILTNILGLLKDKMIIVISHRLENKKLFDKVIYINKGKIYEDRI